MDCISDHSGRRHASLKSLPCVPNDAPASSPARRPSSTGSSVPTTAGRLAERQVEEARRRRIQDTTPRRSRSPRRCRSPCRRTDSQVFASPPRAPNRRWTTDSEITTRATFSRSTHGTPPLAAGPASSHVRRGDASSTSTRRGSLKDNVQAAKEHKLYEYNVIWNIYLYVNDMFIYIYIIIYI